MTNEKIRVLAFGTFDIFHPGHEYYLKEAAKLGDLYVVVARDKTVERVKGKPARNNEKKRLAVIAALPYVAKTLLGKEDNYYDVIEEIAPDVIALGYDQKAFVEGLRAELSARGLNPKIVRFNSFEPHKYKSSLLK